INLEDYFNGQKFFITGLKGTGKTALLRYFAIEAEREQRAHTLFILFKSEIREQDRREFDKVANTMMAYIDQTDATDYTDQYDYEDIW
ncbi:DEAD/DEAH box helicase family protein, partial [Salmonella enterica]|uniref:DEAD/DEAH box helicase family protein n=1 Tax=Salmonella enterica TaxID=28901 RepID=UPI003CF0169C